MAGARTPEIMTTAAIRRLIRAAGREPVERDTLYNVITGPDAPDDISFQLPASSSLLPARMAPEARLELKPEAGSRKQEAVS
jgi:hypothetical protein